MKFEVTYVRENTVKVVVDGSSMQEAVTKIENGDDLRSVLENHIGPPIIKAVVPIESKERLDEG